MNFLLWLRGKPPPVNEPCFKRSPEIEEALKTAEEALTKGKSDLEEIRERRSRLDSIRRDNHFAPRIFNAFKGK